MYSSTVMIIQWIFLVLVICTVPSTSLRCYKCWCPSVNISACDCTDAADVEEGSHCTITQDLHSSNPYIELSSAFLNQSYIRIKDPYYIVVDESIYYNETTREWLTKPKRVVHGCDWDNCNRFSLISSLPDSFQLTINSQWLTDNIYGTGAVTSCHTCSEEVCGNETQSINYDLCPFTSCENSTTCSLFDLWHDVETDEFCYDSKCTPPSLGDEFSEDDEKYKVQVEAIVYLAQNRSNFEIWELDITCAVDNCTRPSIFPEIKQLLQGNVGDLSDFPIIRPSTPAPMTTTATPPPVHPLACYNCSCTGTTCPCTTYEISSADNTYCSISRTQFAQDTYIELGHINRNSTHVYIREYPYVLVEESIVYNELTGKWDTRPEFIIYGCNWNLCNKPEYVPLLPTSFQMRLPEAWLNSSILGSGEPVRDCHECPEGPVCSDNDFIDGSQCPIALCNNTCLVSDSFNDPTSTQQCYQSLCIPPAEEGFEYEKNRVEIEGILYASRPNNVEIWEIDIFCRADDCSRPEIFKELRDNIIFQPGDVTIIFNQTSEEPKIRCFDCSCEGEADCTCDIVSSYNARTTYCGITRIYDEGNVRVYFNSLEIGTSYPKVLEYPFFIVEESILYDNQTSQWITRTNEMVYGCKSDYCNKASLLPSLPSSLQMRLPQAWLNSNILGTGQPVHDCHDCANDTICSLDNTSDGNLCPIQSCNTTCYVSNTFNNLPNNEQCYQSFCVPETSDELGEYDTHRVEIQGVIYSSRPNITDIWEIYIYCRVDNCSRPEIFQEIKQQLTTDTGNLSSLFNQTGIGDAGQLRCYDCYCVDDPLCPCNKTLALPITDGTYCTLIREYDGQDFLVVYEHIDNSTTRLFIREFPYMLVEESILYVDEIGRWVTRPSLIIYGCNTDLCNDPRLTPSLPTGFQLRLPESWLNSSVLGSGAPVRNCHECPDAAQCGTTDFLDVARCPIRECNTTCFVADVFDDPSTDLLCYQSYCLPPDEDVLEFRHRVEIEGILYGNRPNAQVELWEVQVFCRADDCSRPEIFKELESQLTVDLGDLSAFFNITTIPTTTPAPPVEPPLSCYECSCYDDPTCPCTTVQVSGSLSSYCTIVRLNFPDGNFNIDLEHINRNSTRVYIRKFPYLLAEESILYNETTKQWSTRTNLLVYGCNWHLCNHPSRVALLPNSFTMTLSDAWLNANVLDNGAIDRDCHECPDAAQCGTTDFLDSSRCPVRRCNNTCVVSDLFDDPSTGELCYQSFCAAPELDVEENQHRVELEGVIYGDQLNVVELWEIDLYCRADDCSRPEIFNDIRGNITLQTNNITTLLDNSTLPIDEPQIICYDCFCVDNPNCECEKYTVSDAKTSYCTVVRENFGDDFLINLGHIDRNSTRVYIRQFPYLLVEETILYNASNSNWNTRTNLVVFGCNWDYCNDPRYIPYLPESFQMRLSDTWLNTNVIGTGQPNRNCHECPLAPVCSTTGFIDGSLCPIQLCNTTCLVSDLYDDPDSQNQCYQSLCAPPDSEFFTIDPHRVEMEGILYLEPIGRPVELWEIDIFCQADDCSRPTIFDEIREQFTVTIGDLTPFYNITPDTTTTRTTLSTARTTTLVTGTTTTSTVRTTTLSGITTTTLSGTTTPPATSTTQPGQTTTSSGQTTASPGQTTTSPGQTTTRTSGTTMTTMRTTTSGASTCIGHAILLLFFLLLSLINFH